MLTSPVEWGVLAAVGIFLFGSKRIPELGRALGEGITNFKRSIHDTQEEFERPLDDEQEAADHQTLTSGNEVQVFTERKRHSKK